MPGLVVSRPGLYTGTRPRARTCRDATSNLTRAGTIINRHDPDMEVMQDAAHPTLRLARPLVLVGLMGAGKTSVGKRLAAALDVPFVDSDHEIEVAAGMTIPEIFAGFGEPYFRAGERRVIARLLAQPPQVLATGGGAFIDPETRAEIRAHATSVWLRADLELLWQRVRDRPGRPLLETDDPKAVLATLMEQRYPVYAEADVTVESARGLSHEAMARRIIEAVEAHDARAGRRPRTLEQVG
jgi:shikimate kinase